MINNSRKKVNKIKNNLFRKKYMIICQNYKFKNYNCKKKLI